MKRRWERDNALNSPAPLLLGSCLQAAVPRNTGSGAGPAAGCGWRRGAPPPQLFVALPVGHASFGGSNKYHFHIVFHLSRNFKPILRLRSNHSQPHYQLIKAGSNQSAADIISDLLPAIQSTEGCQGRLGGEEDLDVH